MRWQCWVCALVSWLSGSLSRHVLTSIIQYSAGLSSTAGLYRKPSGRAWAVEPVRCDDADEAGVSGLLRHSVPLILDPFGERRRPVVLA